MTINVENMTRLIARLRSPAVEGHFNLASWFSRGSGSHDLPVGQTIHACGTVACIAGHAEILARPNATYHSGARHIATAWLGLTNDQAFALFAPVSSEVNYGKVTASIAADVCQHLLDTGEVDWPPSVRP
jgi:hypothetical protein